MANNTFYFDPAPEHKASDSLARTPWNNKIFPGNYVAHLNAYRDQGVVALPGAVFFRTIGALVINPDVHENLNTDGVLAAGTYDLKILSPDLRQDDKPRRDRPFELPAGAKVYKVSISAPGVREAESLRDAVSGELPGTTTITSTTINVIAPDTSFCIAFLVIVGVPKLRCRRGAGGRHTRSGTLVQDQRNPRDR